MSIILKKLKPSIKLRNKTSPIHCNYSNNYYGDQICICVKNPPRAGVSATHS